jgi:hypothetical protein
MVDKAQPKLGVQLGPVGGSRAPEQRDDIAEGASHCGDLITAQPGRADASKRSEACPGRELAGLGLGDPGADDGWVAAAIESGRWAIVAGSRRGGDGRVCRRRPVDSGL